MSESTSQSAGGKSTAIILRKMALDRYYLDPVHCKKCGKMIEVPEDMKVPQIKKRKFCNSSCSASYNNERRERKKKENVEEKILNTREKLNLRKEKIKETRINNDFLRSNISKKELFCTSKTYQNARSYICRSARKVYMSSDKEKFCIYCGYNLHFDVAHKKSVSEFPGEAKIKEINSIDNLIPLCKNHHWEYDNGFLSLGDIENKKDQYQL